MYASSYGCKNSAIHADRFTSAHHGNGAKNGNHQVTRIDAEKAVNHTRVLRIQTLSQWEAKGTLLKCVTSMYKKSILASILYVFFLNMGTLKGFPGRLRGQKGCRESHPRRPRERNAVPALLAPGPHLGYLQAGRDESISTEVRSKARMSSSAILLKKKKKS